MKKDPAFPFTWTSQKMGEIAEPGLTKREYFAGLAMQGYVSDVENLKMALKLQKFGGGTVAKIIAQSAIEHADALIKELEK